MPSERFYKNESFSVSQTVFLDEEEFKHLVHVMRMRIGEEVELVNGKGSLAQARIESIGKQKVSLFIESLEEEPASSTRLILAQAIPRMPRLEYILEKGVELGVSEFYLFPGEFSEKKELSPSQLQRVYHIVIAALKQCGRLFLPSVTLMPPLAFWDKEKLPSRNVFGDVRKDAPLFLQTLTRSPSNDLLIAVGPEKGFHEKEVICMEEKLGMQGVRLHDNILRTDTAAIASLAVASSFFQASTPP